jgi:hypothetical protein
MPMPDRLLGALCAAVMMPAPLLAQEPASAQLAGEYVHSQMELVAGIRLNADGTFQYGLTVGSLDERAQGRWRRNGDTVELTSDPRPIAPTITAGPTKETPGQPFAIRLVAPNGQDVPGVDFTIAFDTGEPLAAYTTGALWSLPASERRLARSITFSKPSYRLQSKALPLDAQPNRTATFLLTPNDFGVADLTGMRLAIEGDTLVLSRPDGTLRFKRALR